MRRKSLVALGGLILVGVVVLLWIVTPSREKEPVYQGKKLSEWLADFGPNRYPPPAKTQEDTAAIRAIGTNALPLLLKWIDADDGSVKGAICAWIDKHSWFPVRPLSAQSKAIMANAGFHILGRNQAAGAVPALSQIVRNQHGSASIYAVLALAALDLDEAAKAGVKFSPQGGISGWTRPTPGSTN